MAYKFPYDYEEQVKYEAPKLKTNRKMWKVILFSILTLGFYSVIFFSSFASELDLIYPKRDGTKTMDYLIAYIVSFFTCNLVVAAWQHSVSLRIEEALIKRRITYNFGTTDFWAWYVLGSVILIGPAIYIHKMCTAMNLLCESYNENPDIDSFK